MNNDQQVDKEYQCLVCSGTNFAKNEGFYYCEECGTQAHHIRDFEFDDDVPFETDKPAYTSKIKINPNALSTATEITSWECFNYFIHGMVDELIVLGGNDELKLYTLQLWTAYLRKSEVAFFNNKYIQLPKLGPCHNARDAKILYNHELAAKKRTKKAVAVKGGRGALQRQKNILAKSEYEAYTLSLSEAELSGHSSSTTSKYSSGSGGTNRPIRLSFTNSARKHYKKFMPSKHIDKHEMDDQKKLSCHILGGKKSLLNRKLCMLQLSKLTACTILYIALNLSNDQIQLSDMLRFMREGHISTTDISHYFPENIAKDCIQTINRKEFSSNRKVFLDCSIRKHAVTLCQFLQVSKLNLPNLTMLVTRYCTDFCLPTDIAIYAERLINLTPPQMKFRYELLASPFYEARALAYIIFLLKLLFGIDDNKEYQISETSKIINIELKKFKKPELFVWSDWIEYIEMRKILLLQHNAIPNDQSLNMNYINDNYVNELINENVYTHEDITKWKRKKLQNMKTIIQQYLNNSKIPSRIDQIDFRPTMTPHRDYLETILQYSKETLTNIPDLLHINHSIKEIQPFVDVSDLREVFKSYSIRLNCVKLDCKNTRNYYKVFRLLTRKIAKKDGHKKFKKYEFDIDETEWLEKIQQKSLNMKKEEDEIMIPIIEEPKIKHKNVFKKKNYDKDYLSEENCSELGHNDDINKIINMNVSAFDYWTLFGRMDRLTDSNFAEIRNKFPSNFLWLMQNFSKYLGIDMKYLYQELLEIENNFLFVLQDSSRFDAELARIVDTYKNNW